MPLPIKLVKDTSKNNITVIANNTTSLNRSATITISANGVSSTTIDVLQQATTGINNNDGFPDIKIYPNPSNAKINIDYYLDKKGTVEVDIFDIMGRISHQSLIQNQETGNQHLEFDLSDYSNKEGLFFIRLILNHKTYITKVMFCK